MTDLKLLLFGALSACFLAAGANYAVAGGSPFAPAPKPQPRTVRLLAPSGLFAADAFKAFEQESGVAVAYDAYGDPGRVATMLRDGPYDVAIVAGPDVARLAAAGRLARIDSVPNAKAIAPQVAAKLAAYDPGGYALAWGWSPTGLLYDAAKALTLLGGQPNSWAAALAPNVAGRLAPCGVALPDSRDELFVAAWRLMGVDPTRLTERNVSAAADLLIAARQTARLPVSRDTIAAIAGGAVCLAFGGPVQAEIAARRSREGGEGIDIRYAQPREGGPLAVYALVALLDARHPSEAALLIDFLLRPEVLAETTARAGMISAAVLGPVTNFRALWPIGAYDAKIAPVVEQQWARVQRPMASAAGQPASGKGGGAKRAAAGPRGAPSGRPAKSAAGRKH